MAQLNAPVTDIQLKSNMIIQGASNTDWASDSKYPSAKAVSDKINTIAPGKIEHPIGSVLITATNENPATKVGGTWEFIDKEYKAAVGSIDSQVWTPSMSGASPSAEVSGFVLRTNHSMHLTLQVTTKVAISLTNSYSLGRLTHDRLGGAPNLPWSFGYTGSAFAHATYTSGSTLTSCTVRYSIGSTGDITIFEIHNTNKQLPVDTTLYINTPILMDPAYMGDSFCDKFYWKRTA